jgi:hypothetical protein
MISFRNVAEHGPTARAQVLSIDYFSNLPIWNLPASPGAGGRVIQAPLSMFHLSM